MANKVIERPSIALKSLLKKIPGLVTLNRVVRHPLRRVMLDPPILFPLYAPCSSGGWRSRARLTIKTINHLIPALQSLTASLGYTSVRTLKCDELLTSDGQFENARNLKALFDEYQSDKSTTHNYHLLYGYILENRPEVKRVFEVGLGTNNTDIVSHMGRSGRPGASLRAFRDFLENAQIFGADLDRRVLFTEQRIQTYYVDQTDEASFEALGKQLPSSFNLMIDDGLHSPNANLRSLKFFLPRLCVGGWAVIEDIGEASLPLWEMVGAILPPRYEATIFKTEAGLLFAVKRIE